MRSGNVLWIVICTVLAAIGFAEESIDASLQLPGKKGVCFTLRDPKSKKGTWVENIPKVKALNASWNYSWGSTLVPVQPKDMEFVPMIWGAKSAESVKERIANDVIPQVKAGKVKRLLGFNEPDHHNQSGITYKDALKYWPLLESVNVPLCSPACANPEGIKDPSAQGIPGTWMRDFMREVDKRGLRVDYVGAHWYGGANAQSFKTKMRRIYEMYGRRPLLITEFAPADWEWKKKGKNRHSRAAVLKFMKEVLPWMEEQDWIAGYAWFSFRQDQIQGTSSALFDRQGKLTACGRFYASVTPDNPKGDQSIKPDGM